MAHAIEKRRPCRTAEALPPATRSVETGLANLARHGVTLHEGFIDDAFADRLRERMDEQAYMERKLGIGRVGDESGLSATATCAPTGDIRNAAREEVAEPIYQILDSLVNKGAVFRELMMNPIAHQYAHGVFGDYPWNVWGMNGIITRRGSREQFLHTDTQTLPQDMLTRPVLFNCFVCVSDFDLEMGPTSFVPGSHLGDRPRYDGDERAARSVSAARKGTAIIWDGSTWHGQSEHASDKTRYAIALSYCLYAIRPGENFAASVQDDVYDKLTEAELKVLGFQTTMVGVMNAFGPRNRKDRHHGIGSTTTFIPELRRS